LINKEISNEINPLTKEKLKRQLKENKKDTDDVSKQLADLDSKDNSRIKHSELESKLPEIDFNQLKEAMRKIFDGCGDEGYAALLLFQRSTRMGGKWCAAHIREILGRETQQGQFRHIPLEFNARDDVEAVTLLNAVGKHLGISYIERDINAFSAQIVDTLCGSLRTGHVVLIECQKCEYLLTSPEVFRWVVVNFWGSIVQSLAEVAKEYDELKVFFVLFVDGSLNPDCLDAAHRCTLDTHEKHKFLEVPLENWSRDDISRWLAKYSGLNLTRIQQKRMADKIYTVAEGVPKDVVEQLLSECQP
jgi:hypothetical protein